MTCTSCHDPHKSVAPEDRVTFYRTKCLACHGAGVFAFKHHPKQPDCAGCHMPQIPSTDVAHTEVTDHRILRHPESQARGTGTPADSHGAALPELAPFPSDAPPDPRDFALAWQSIVSSGMTAAQPKAEQLLREALKSSPSDPALLSALGYIAQQKGDSDQARALYQKALQEDSTLVDAAANLGVLEAQQGHVAEAIKLWQSAFERAPGRSEIGMNLARVYCGTRQFDAARDSVLRVLRFNPDLAAAKKLITGLTASPAECPL